jgi:hypothetical protein
MKIPIPTILKGMGISITFTTYLQNISHAKYSLVNKWDSWAFKSFSNFYF